MGKREGTMNEQERISLIQPIGCIIAILGIFTQIFFDSLFPWIFIIAIGVVATSLSVVNQMCKEIINEV